MFSFPLGELNRIAVIYEHRGEEEGSQRAIGLKARRLIGDVVLSGYAFTSALLRPKSQSHLIVIERIGVEIEATKTRVIGMLSSKSPES